MIRVATKALMSVVLGALMFVETAAQARDKPYDTHIAFIVLNVADLERSLDFYKRIVGMVEIFRYDLGNGVTEVGLGFTKDQIPTGAHLALIHNPNPPNGLTHGTYFNRFAIATPNIERAYRIAQQEGVTLLTTPAPINAPRFNVDVFFARDPDGYLVEVLEWIEVEKRRRRGW